MNPNYGLLFWTTGYIKYHWHSHYDIWSKWLTPDLFHLNILIPVIQFGLVFWKGVPTINESYPGETIPRT